MKTRKTITKFTIVMALAALAVAGLLCDTAWLPRVGAQTGDRSVKFLTYSSIGIVPGQKARLCVANTGTSGGTATLSFSWYLAHGSNSASTIPLNGSDWMQVPQGEFRCADVSRADLKTEGEPETGRAQLLVKTTIIAPAGSSQEAFPASLEVIGDENEAVQTDSKYRMIILAAQRSKLDAPIGFLPGESLRYSILNPNEEGSQPVRATAYIYDSAGRLMSQSQPVKLEPGDLHTFRFNRDDLRVTGEEGTGRVQARPIIIFEYVLPNPTPTVKLPGWMELVDDRTGSTIGAGGDYFTGSVTVSDDGFGG